MVSSNRKKVTTGDKHSSKYKMKKNSSSSAISVLPKDLMVEILARVAASSSNDFFNSKLSCKEFYEISDEDYIYKHVSLDGFCVVAWKEEERAISFLRRCRESGNPEALFRQGVIDYFSLQNKLESGIEYLRKSAKSGHLAASYVLGVILVCNCEQQEGMELLEYVKVNKRLGYCRWRLQDIIRRLWLNRNNKLNAKPNSCPMQENHRRKEGWPNLSLDDEDDKFGCNECSFDREIKFVCRLF